MTIKIVNSTNVTIRGNIIKNFPRGIEAIGSDIKVIDTKFDNVLEPFNIKGGTSVISGSRIANDPKRQPAGKSAYIGWVKPNGPPLPAFCRECKTIFASKNYNFGGAYFNAWDNEETCPDCGSEHAFLSEGIFDLTSEAVQILTAPDITHAMLAAVAKAASGAFKSDFVDPESVLATFRKIHRGLEDLLRRALEKGRSFFHYAIQVAGIGSFILAGLQTQLAREQTGLAREQTHLARQQLADTTQTKILEALQDIRANQSGLFKPKKASDDHLRDVSAGGTAPEGRSVASDTKKRKARYERKRTDAARRRAFQGRGQAHRTSPARD